MIGKALNAFAWLIRKALRWSLRSALILSLIFLNLATLISPLLYDTLSKLFRDTISTVAEIDWSKRPTHAQLHSDLNRTQVTLQEVEAEVENRKWKIHNLNKELRRTVAKGKIKDEVMTKLLRRSDVLAEELSISQRRLLAIQQDVDGKRVRIDELTRRLLNSDRVQKESVSEITILRNKMGGLENQLSVARKAISGQSNDLATASSEAIERRLRVTVREDVTVELNRKAGDIIDGMQRRVAKATARNISANVIDAVPFLGTGTALGMIAWDVYDMCQYLTDIRKLQKVFEQPDQKLRNVAESESCSMSRAELFAAFTGKDLGFEACVEARIATLTISPPGCKGYEIELPDYDHENDKPVANDIVLPNYD